jgi:hypothetical protein
LRALVSRAARGFFPCRLDGMATSAIILVEIRILVIISAEGSKREEPGADRSPTGTAYRGVAPDGRHRR